MLKDSTALHEATTDDVIRIRYTGRLDGFAVIQGPRLRHAGHTITGRVQEAGSRVERYPAAANLTGYPGKIGAMTTD